MTTFTHRTIDPAILYWGTPVVLISTTNEDGSPNLAPISSAFWLGSTAVLGFGLSSHSLTNLKRTGECVINLPDEGLVDAVNKLALTTGAPAVAKWKTSNGYRHVGDKFGIAGLTPVESDHVAALRAAECPATMEAKLLDVRETDFALVTLQVVAVHVHDHLRLAGHPNRVDPDVWRPLIMSFQRFYGLGSELRSSTLATINEESYR